MLSLGKPTQQSSTHTVSEGNTTVVGSSDKAVDGCTLTHFNSGCCTHTSAMEISPWWGVDLGATYGVVLVRVLNRRDCCGTIILMN